MADVGLVSVVAPTRRTRNQQSPHFSYDRVNVDRLRLCASHISIVDIYNTAPGKHTGKVVCWSLKYPIQSRAIRTSDGKADADNTEVQFDRHSAKLRLAASGPTELAT